MSNMSNMNDDVSQLERAPDSLRSAVDPQLEAPQHQEHLVSHDDFTTDPDLDHHQQAHLQALAQEQLDHEVHDLHDHEDHDMHDPHINDLVTGEHQEAFSPRRGFTHKRLEEPPRSAQGKFMCKFQNTCTGLTFDRRCEWSKHMDKHDRPYKCAESGCEKLQGFTYSGGLLRHQREVHKMHGGTRKPMYCPEPNCKRNTGAGFTRKENLSEHIRRVHRRTTDGSEMTAQAQNGLAQLEAAAAAQAAAEEDDGLSDGERAAKRKRFDPALLNGDYDLDLSESDPVKRLRNENQELKDRMKQMEEEMQSTRTLLQELLTRNAPAPTANMMVSPYVNY